MRAQRASKDVHAEPRNENGRAKARPSHRSERRAQNCLGIQLGDVVPVHQVLDERLEIVRAAVAVIDVVGVLPHIDAEDRGSAGDQRALAVRALGDDQLAVLHRQPGPAGAELGDAGLDEIFLELLHRADVLDDLLLELAGNGAAAIRLHPVPEVQVVIVLAGIVEEAGILAERALHDLLEGLALEFGALQQVVAVVHISEVVLVVMVFQRLARHVRRKGVIGIGQIGKRERHVAVSAIGNPEHATSHRTRRLACRPRWKHGRH